MLPLAVEGVRRNLRHPITDILIIAPADSQLRQLAPKIGCRYVCEDDVIPIRKRDIKYTVNAVDRSGWLLQQLLKLGADAFVGTDRYLVVDADTILLKPQVFVADSTDILLHEYYYHYPYLEMYVRLMNLTPKTLITSIAHQMLFNKSRLRSLKARIERVGNTAWYTSIINASDLTESSCFSEYETYGQWCITMYQDGISREYAFNFSLSRRLISSVQQLMNDYGHVYRSLSLHHYLD